MSALDPFAPHPRWVWWRNEDRGGKLTKVPYNPASGSKARADDPRTWGLRAAADAQAAKRLNGARGGIGIQLGDLGDGTALGGIDLDTCRAADGRFEPWAEEIIRRFASYTEVSPSGTGAKVFFRYRTKDLPRLRTAMGDAQHGRQWKRANGSGHPPAIELYLSNRYFATTERRLDDVPDEIVTVDAGVLLWLIEQAGPAFAARDKTGGADKSRSAAAFRKALQLRRAGASYDELVDALEADPDTSDWLSQKGRANGSRELKRIWAKAGAIPARRKLAVTIKLSGGSLSDAIDQAEQALLDHDRDVYQRGDFLVRPAPQSVLTTGRDRALMRLARVTPVNLTDRLTRIVDFQRFDRRIAEWLSVNCPAEIAKALIDRTGGWRLRELAGIVNAPTLREDGSILDKPGYDAATGILYLPSETYPPIPARPTAGAARAALDVLIGDLINEFPFGAEDDTDATGQPSPSRSVALSTILTTLIRRSLPSAPLHAFTAPVMGSGKSKLVNVASLIATGHEAAVTAQGKTEDEMEKRLGAALINGAPMISFDNCEAPLGGELICQALTERSLQIRILGKSTNVRVTTGAMFAATGNNLVIAGDLARRTLVCTLDPHVERPETRRFDADPVDIIRGSRAPYVVAALTVLRAYVVAGRPQQDFAPLGSFEGWSSWVRAALVWLGEPDPVITELRIRDEDPQVRTHTELTRQWHAAIGESEVTAKRAIEIAGETETWGELRHPELRDAMLEVAGDPRNAINPRRLGKWLAGNKGRVVKGFRIEQGAVADRSGVVRWRARVTP